MEIQHRSHLHMLTLTELTNQKVTDQFPYCFGCNGRLCDPIYICKHTSDCRFRLHKSCTELPSQVPHPLHPQHHLTLDDINQSQFLICNGCGDLFQGFRYQCSSCKFILDVKCALLMDGYVSDHEILERKKRANGATLNHLSHHHMLYLCNFRQPYDKFQRCCCCDDVISRFAYACMDCEFYIHELCMENIPKEEVQLIFHPRHRFRARPIRIKDELTTCHACDQFVSGVSVKCTVCDINLHVLCADFFRQALKSKRHEHHLFLFESSKIPEKYSKTCDQCHGNCTGYCYRCIECRMNFHLECIPLPSLVRHICHNLHPLAFMDSFVEDESGEYYCDVCEKPRNPKCPVYCCEDCPLIAHVECIISKDDHSLEILSYLSPRCNVKEQDNNTEDESDAGEGSPEIGSEIANLQAQMEALVAKLEDTKGSRTSKLKFTVSSFIEEITEL